MQEYTKHTYALMDVTSIYFLRSVIKKKNVCLYPEIGQSFEESTRGDKLVKYLDIFIEFGFCMMWRIILEAVIHLCLIINILLDLHYSSHHKQFS